MTGQKILGAFSEDKKVFTFTLEPRNWFEKMLFKFGLKERIKQLPVSPITLGARARYSKYSIKLDVGEVGKGVSATRAALLMSLNHTDDLIMAIATVINNKDENPPAWLVRALRNATQNDIDELIIFMTNSVDIMSFLNSIILINGMSLQTEEIIAPEKQKDLEGIK
ncbi:hypothetical protein [Sphingobacterium thalpophilum]|uniref:hypothetical protein n=1 Tax=Sphingobacterium thalpophilum TaxID=259 RepID=UPI0024A77DA0|nr:hypothetical protein [Sphingobacterium thalpophilum]